MTMNRIMEKLRKSNRGQYRILGTCIFLSVFLVTAFTCMYFSKNVQGLLPQGGDTRKLVWVLLFAAVAGCTIFTVYGAKLFLKYKSREFGVLLALGESRKKLSLQLTKEIAAIIVCYVLAGIITAVPFSWLIWKVFESLVINAGDLSYRFSLKGVGAGILFSAFLVLCIGKAGRSFVKRANIMDILNDRRKTEMVKEIRPWTGKAGVGLIIIGLFLSMGVPKMWTMAFLKQVPVIWNVTWLIPIVGLYLFLLSAVGHTRKGRSGERYYKNIISTNLMRFTARQTTRNMCVIALLVFVMMISILWAMVNYDTQISGGNDAPFDYTLHYPALENQLTKQEIEDLAENYRVEITSYEETQALELIIRYAERDLDDNGNYFDITAEKLASFLSASAFEQLSGIPVDLSSGEYMTVTNTDYKEMIWRGPDGMQEIENPVTGEILQPSFAGTVEFDNLTRVSEPFVFLIADEDYRTFAETLDRAWMENMVFFNVKDVFETYAFATELNNEFIRRSSPLSDHIYNYDAHEEALALAAGKEYGYTGPAGLSVDNTRLMGDWKYAPFSKVLQKEDAMQMVAIFVLLCAYIAIISLAAMSVMGYVRSMTVAMDNQKLFEDLEKLGADRKYRERAFRQQLRKIFAYPMAAGYLISLLFTLFLTYFNDMRMQPFEWKALGIQFFTALCVGSFLFVLYRISMKKGEAIIGL